MKVTRGNILLLVDKLPEVSELIKLTDDKGEPSDRAEVIATGPDSVVGVGDRVVFNNRAGRFVKLDDKEYILVSTNDIFIILEKENK